MEVKRAQVHMLPSAEKTMILRNTYCFSKAHGNPLHYGKIENAVKRGFEYQQLYFTIDERPKAGDWYLVKVDGKYIKESLAQLDKGEEEDAIKWNCRKIIATTDHKLTASFGNDGEIYGKMKDGLPQPTSAFQQKYCKLGGINEVSVEYYETEFPTMAYSDYSYDELQEINEDACNFISELKIKVDPIHNTITIHPIKDSFSLNELEVCVHDVVYKMMFGSNMFPEDQKTKMKEFINDWINTNATYVK